MRILISGSQNFQNLDSVEFWLSLNFSTESDILIINGETNVDALLEKWAIDNDIAYESDLEDLNRSIVSVDKTIIFYDGKDPISMYIIGLALKHKKHLEVLF